MGYAFVLLLLLLLLVVYHSCSAPLVLLFAGSGNSASRG